MFQTQTKGASVAVVGNNKKPGPIERVKLRELGKMIKGYVG